jgi:hypothetical protein
MTEAEIEDLVLKLNKIEVNWRLGSTGLDVA